MKIFNIIFGLFFAISVMAEEGDFDIFNVAESIGNDYNYLGGKSREDYAETIYHDLTNKSIAEVDRKVKFKLFFHGEISSDLRPIYESAFPSDKYYCFESSLAKHKKKDFIPILLSRRSKKKLLEQLSDFYIGGEMVVYAKVEKLRIPKKERKDKNLGKEQIYALTVDDIYLHGIKTDSKDEELSLLDSGVPAGLNSLVGSDVSLKTTFKSLVVTPQWKYVAKGDNPFNNISYQVLRTSFKEEFCYLVISKSKAKVLETLTTVNSGREITIHGKIIPYPANNMGLDKYFCIEVNNVILIEQEQEEGSRLSVPEKFVEDWQY